MPARPKALIAIGLAALACTACGRRGALEPPGAGGPAERVAAPSPVTASPRALPQSVGLGIGTAPPDPEAVRDGEELSLAATPAANSDVPVRTTRGAKRGYVVPREPFFLDPLL